ncbi:hypothetical protein AYO41_01545 [Verrucomicrobia bacterium SCGC AG-212-E04]|nr:hypothetical protein AYO41_01545 [Verrucomicrobia bacterium SCGC AG-212-E04]
MSPTEVPHLRCGRRSFGDISTDATATPWDSLMAVPLRENVTGAAAAAGTTLRAGWDDAAWHLLFVCEAEKPWATITEHDGPLWNEEVVEVFLDPVGDLQSYYELEVNPLNTVCDLVLRRLLGGWRKEFAWHCEGLHTAVRRTPNGWNAALRIPFATVTNDPVREGTIWRGNFLRIDRPGGASGAVELSAWSPTFGPTFHRAERFGLIEFCA